MASFSWPASGSGGGVPAYINFAAFPPGTNAGDLAVAADTGNLYEWTGSAWQQIAGPGAALSLGNLDAQAGAAKGAALTGSVLSMQSASGSVPGLVNTTTQTFAGQKTFSTGLTGTLTGSASLNVLTSALGNLTDVGTDGITVTNGTGAVVGNVSLAQHVADTTHNGYLSSTDWNTFNGKQAAGNYITDLTGDVTASGPGSVAATVAKIQGTVVSGTTGSSNVVFSNSPVLVTPALGTPASGLATNLTGLPLTSGVTGILPIANGGTNSNAVVSAPAASAWAGWDANKNFSANSLIEGYRTQATGAGTTTLVVGDAQIQVFTGSTTQTVIMPVTSTLVTGQIYTIVNQSSGVVTVQSSGTNTIQAMAANTQLILTCVSTSGTGTASWVWNYAQIANALPATGSVTSVQVAGTKGLSFSGGPITGSGTITASLTVPSIQKFTSTGTTTGWLFTISTSSTVAVNDTYTNNGNTYTVLNALSAQSGQVLFCSGASAPLSSGTLTRSAGAGTSSISFTATTALATYTTPANTLYIKVKMVGGGGGGGGSGTAAGTAATAGTVTAFGPSLLIANGGGLATFSNSGGAGGSASLGSGPVGLAVSGTGGMPALVFPAGTSGTQTFPGQPGACSALGGGGSVAYQGGGNNAATNSGSGGGGGSVSGNASTAVTGSSGGSGGFVEAIITSPSATYIYCIGTAGSGGGAGTAGTAGGNGAAGVIVVEEHYQ